MGEVVEVPGVTEASLRDAAIDRTLEMVNIVPVLAAHEFKVSDWVARVKDKEGIDISESTAIRHLEELVKQGKLGSEKRKDERVGRMVTGYWYVEG